MKSRTENPTRSGGDLDRERWRALATISLAVVLSLTTWFSATAVTPELTAVWILSTTEAAWMTNAVQVGFVIAALLASLFNLPDIVKLNKLMAMAAVCAGLANAGLLLEPGGRDVGNVGT